MSNRKDILEYLKANKEGMTFKELNNKFNLEHALYEYLKRLRSKGLVETFIPRNRVGKAVGFRATEKAWEEERKTKALEKLEIIEAMTNRGAIKYYKDKITQDEIDKLEEEI